MQVRLSVHMSKNNAQLSCHVKQKLEKPRSYFQLPQVFWTVVLLRRRRSLHMRRRNIHYLLCNIASICQCNNPSLASFCAFELHQLPMRRQCVRASTSTLHLHSLSTQHVQALATALPLTHHIHGSLPKLLFQTYDHHVLHIIKTRFFPVYICVVW